MRVGGEQRHDALGKRARGKPRRLGQHHGGVGGEVAVAGVLRRLERDALDARLVRHDAVMLELLDGSQHAAVEPCKDVHDCSRMVLARLTQFGSGVKQAPVLGERVAVGHAGDEVADIAGIALAPAPGRAIPAAARRDRRGSGRRGRRPRVRHRP